jgi:LysM repeat protein
MTFSRLIKFIFKKERFILLVFLVLIIDSSLGQKRMTTEEYINKYKDIAIKKMEKYGIPASITLAQGILESGSGNSKLAKKANNHFGIKCHNDWYGRKFYMDDDEKHECFRKYSKPEDSFRDHSLFLTQRGRYSFLFNYDITDYKKWAYGLKKAGYATNNKYPQLLINIIDKYKLYQYDSKKGSKSAKKHKKHYEAGPIPDIANLKEAGTTKKGREIYVNNKRKLVFAKSGDTYKKIAREFDLFPYQIRKYNDVNKRHVLRDGEIVYVKNKRSKADKMYHVHIVKQGETLWQISQLYGIKLKDLLYKNNLSEGMRIPVGTKLKLR